MTWLSLILIAKIFVTLAFIAAPFLLAPPERLGPRLGVQKSDALFFRLYGVAMLAILSVYVNGLVATFAGSFPWYATVMGVISNGVAFAVILGFGAFGRLAPLASFFAFVALGLGAAMLAPDLALQKVF